MCKYHLPAAGVLPVQVQAVKVVLLNKLDHILDEPRPGGGAVDQPAVLVALAVIPAAQGQGDLSASGYYPHFTHLYWLTLMPCFLNSVTFLYMSLPE